MLEPLSPLRVKVGATYGWAGAMRVACTPPQGAELRAQRRPLQGRRLLLFKCPTLNALLYKWPTLNALWLFLAAQR